MRTINLVADSKREKLFNRKPADEGDCADVIEEPCVIKINGKKAVILLYDEDVSVLHRGVTGIKDFYAGARGSGLKNEARVFGFSPRMPTRNHHDYCSVSRLAIDCPVAHSHLMTGAQLASNILAKHCADKYRAQFEWIQDHIRPEWCMKNSVFTSGIVNRTSQLKYHYDRGNIKGGWSCMYVLKDGIRGGDLSIPSLNVTLRLPHGAALMFDGQSLLHGVTPIKLTKTMGQRYSIVYYTLDAMKNCLAPDDEIRRAQKMRDEREKKWLTSRK